MSEVDRVVLHFVSQEKEGRSSFGDKTEFFLEFIFGEITSIKSDIIINFELYCDILEKL